MHYYLDFEKPVAELENKIEELKHLADGEDMNITSEIKKLEKKAKDLRADIFLKISPWQKTLIARHPERPYTLDYINLLMKDFIELHGDRKFADDPAIVAGFAKFQDIAVAVVGHQKGRSTKSRIERNFGQPHPEGYRKAIRIMKLAEKFGMPIITFIDTPGAYPGIGAEERGQAEAIAKNLLEMFTLKTPIIAIVIGEGGSGGALALAIGDKVLMLEHSVYSVISPEGCAAILWKKNTASVGQDEYEKASAALKMTAQDLHESGIIDGIIPEPLGGAHRNQQEAAEAVENALRNHLVQLMEKPSDTLIEDRYEKFRIIGKLA
ncbi:MAG: acetyl-CoA carboxylase carboxyltransferase subunit alpha [Thermodesulfovibrionia bacterium]|nr:acetyl-CoA carboxylase carboxyltransferase subunit alpha [Thermodesulfovibrionia bacterium]